MIRSKVYRGGTMLRRLPKRIDWKSSIRRYVDRQKTNHQNHDSRRYSFLAWKKSFSTSTSEHDLGKHYGTEEDNKTYRKNDGPPNKNKKINNNFVFPSLFDEAHEMIMAAYISYPITFLLREARKGTLNQSERFHHSMFNNIHGGNVATYLSPRDFIELVQANHEYISQHVQNKLNDEYGWFRVFLNFQQMAGITEPDSISLLEFDDRNDSHRLAYGIGVNRHAKRITVIFRGTYADETDDWKRNLQFAQLEAPIPESIWEDDDDDDDHDDDDHDDNKHDHPKVSKIWFHRGCYEYLFHNSGRGPDYPRERYEEILSNIIKCLERYPDYKIYVCGHSLGGALATLLAFYLAADAGTEQYPNVAIPKPITCVSVGSLLVGDANFQQAFARLESPSSQERKRRRRRRRQGNEDGDDEDARTAGYGRLRHLRITNQHDPIPSLPPFPWYKPVGVHLHLHDKVGYSLYHPSMAKNNIINNDVDSSPKQNAFLHFPNSMTTKTTIHGTDDTKSSNVSAMNYSSSSHGNEQNEKNHQHRHNDIIDPSLLHKYHYEDYFYNHQWANLWNAMTRARSMDDLLIPHLLPEYLKRIERERNNLESFTMEELLSSLTNK